ncbi:MAG: hypothetical protein E6J90_00915 [Deltaproteobacteria bacterium]|nr:MAG: hypothetical protein E6J90_00915 [Deltaproteobacteria bacterium]
MRTSLCLPAIAAAALGLACSGDKAPATQGSAGSAGSAAATPAGVEIFVNDASVATIPPAQIAKWPRLDTLVPGDARKLGTWELVTVQTARPKPSELAHPSSNYPDMVPAIFPGDGGAPAFGMFDAVELAKKGKAALREDHVSAIRIKVAQGGNRGQNDDGGGAAADPTKLVVTVKTKAGTTTLTGEKLLALPREGTPGNPDQKGWRLTALLDAAGVKAYDHLVLTDASGTNLLLDRKDISDTSVPFIKLNKQGSLRLRVWKKAGDGWNGAGDLRGLAAIEAR